MASLGFHQGCLIQKQASYGYLSQEHPDRVSGSTHLNVKLPNNKLSSSFNSAALTCDSSHRSKLSLLHNGFDLQTERIRYNDKDIESPRVSENFDEWIQSSVSDIVKNITHAPLLVQIYADGKVTTKKSQEAKEWKNVNKHKTSSSSLEGVILVEELPADEFDGDRAFGVLIQGKNKSRNECRSSCYLLKTSSVNDGGLGHVCTHFCLMKVQSFHKNAFQQFSDSWLVQ